MIVKDEMILARPGWNKKYKREVTWEELKRTFLLYKRIPMIVAGGSHFGPIDPNDAIGHVDAKIYDDEQVIRGLPTFYKERFHDVPAEIQSKLAERQHVHTSLGYEPFDDIRKIDHILIGANSPVFEDIGFHAESTFMYEETEGMNNEEKPPEKTGSDFVTKEDFEAFTTKVFDLLKPKEPVPEAPTEEVLEPEKEDDIFVEEAPPAEEPTVTQQTPKVEPERVLAKTQPTDEATSDGLFVAKGNTRIFSTPLGGHARPTNKQKGDKT